MSAKGISSQLQRWRPLTAIPKESHPQVSLARPAFSETISRAEGVAGMNRQE